MVLLIPAGTRALALLVLGSKSLNLPLGVVNYDVLDWYSKCNFSEISGNYTDISAMSNSLSCAYLSELRKDIVVKLVRFIGKKA